MRKQLREIIIKPVLQRIGLYSKEAEDLLYGTVCAESLGGQYIKQAPSGPACGIFQMEPATARDIYANYLKYKPELKAKIDSLRCEGLSLEENLIGNLFFAAAMCRIHYLRVAEKIPSDLLGLAGYWKKYYNTSAGKGVPAKFIEEYKK